MTDEEQAPNQEAEKLPGLEQELKDCKDKYLRLLAESENTRKRMQKEKLDTIKFALDNVLSEIITPLDNFENALAATKTASDETKNWAKGFQMILSQFKDILAQNGVTPFKSEGTDFDPHMHEAVETEETEDHPEGTVVREFVRGYKSGDRVLRPARVKVAMPPNKKESDENQNQK